MAKKRIKRQMGTKFKIKRRKVSKLTMLKEEMKALKLAFELNRQEKRQTEERYDKLLKRVPPPFYWTTREGDRIRPEEMDEGHLRNTISFLQRRLVYKIGTTTWLSRVHYEVLALHHMLSEASRRNIDV